MNQVINQSFGRTSCSPSLTRAPSETGGTGKTGLCSLERIAPVIYAISGALASTDAGKTANFFSFFFFSVAPGHSPPMASIGPRQGRPSFEDSRWPVAGVRNRRRRGAETGRFPPSLSLASRKYPPQFPCVVVVRAIVVAVVVIPCRCLSVRLPLFFFVFFSLFNPSPSLPLPPLPLISCTLLRSPASILSNSVTPLLLHSDLHYRPLHKNENNNVFCRAQLKPLQIFTLKRYQK